MKSAVRRVLLLSALMSPNALYALGLGEIHLHSALNQPFDADIDLVSAADEDLSTLRASLAPSDIFARYGIDKPAYLADFTFRVVRGPGGKDYLKVTSPRPVTEPFVTMLVAADWPRGRLLREYTVLLDPPVFAPSPQAAEPSVAAPLVQSSAAAPSPAPARQPEPAPASSAPAAAAPERPAAARPLVTAGSDYRVQPNDTLWKIASEAHPGSRSDVNRAMVAIFQTNPHAFDGNINVLRAGRTLRIPDAAAVSAIPASAAAAEVSRQYRLWRDGTSAAQSSDDSSGRLRLVTPEQGAAGASTATVPATSATPAAGPSATQLQSRVQQLESELAEARRLLEVKNAELATLQGQGPAGEPEAGTAAPGAPAPGAEVPAAGAPPASGPPPEAVAPPAQAQPAPAPKPAPEVKKPPAEVGPSLTERLAGYWWVVLGLLATALAFVLYRRSRGQSGDKELGLQEALARTRTDLRGRGPAQRDTTIVVEERRPVEPAPRATAATRAPEPTRKPVSDDDTISGEEPVSIESGDPLAEADFHMAYGLYDQAADLVQLAIKRAPQRRDLKLKLLEIFFVWGNRDRFLELAREMNASRDDAQPGEWDKILIMGKQIAPEDGIFAAARPVASRLDMELHGSAGPLDMDLGADRGSASEIDFPSEGQEGTVDGGLDFEFTEPASGEDAFVPTVETTRINVRAGTADDPTQEVPIEDLGLEVGDLDSLDDTSGGEDMLATARRAEVEDTVESPRISNQAASPDEDEDLLSTTGILKDPTGILTVQAGILKDQADILTVQSGILADRTDILKEQTGILRGLDTTGEIPTIEYGDPTSQMPTIKTTRLPSGSSGAVDFDLGDEPFTMSEVGTKLDLARAYVDMGDPEGARSILDEVLKEGSAEQKQEAERLMASLP